MSLVTLKGIRQICCLFTWLFSVFLGRQGRISFQRKNPNEAIVPYNFIMYFFFRGRSKEFVDCKANKALL